MAGPSIPEEQRESAEEMMRQGLGNSTIAKTLGMDPRTVEKYRVRAKIPNPHARHMAPGAPLDPTAPGGPDRSTLVDSEGNTVMQWVKYKADRAEAEHMQREVFAAMADELPRTKRIKKPRKTDSDLLPCFNIGDPHFGMYSWAEETGDDYDLVEATRLHCGAMEMLVDATAPADECLINQLGDYFHADDDTSRTPASGHYLDTDTRHMKVMRVGVQALRHLIDLARSKHGLVRVRNAPGNHDPKSYMALTLALEAYYEREPRVIIESSPAQFWWNRWGNNLIGVTHGHSIKPDRMPGVLAVEAAQEWDARHKYVWHGHIHKGRRMPARDEEFGVVVESFRTLAGRDAWHAGQGYRSGRDMACVILDREFGEVLRHTCPVQYVEAMASRAA